MRHFVVRRQLDAVIRSESDWIVNKLRRKGYEMEGTILGIYGVFTRGVARGKVELERTSSETP